MKQASITLLFMLVGCDGGAPADAGMDGGMEPTTVSCNNDPLYICDESVVPPARFAELEAECLATGDEAEWALETCPSMGNLGGCIATGGPDGDVIRYHYADGDFFTPADVEAHCTDEGQTYVAAP